VNEHEKSRHEPEAIRLDTDASRTPLGDQVVDLRQVSNDDQRRSDESDPLGSFEHGDSPMTLAGKSGTRLSVVTGH
jgi:hypothetical protein